MAGAIIPDDWDGVTYKCRRVVWPSSEQWIALLLGQVTEPAFVNFWDAGSGDEDQAVDDVDLAEQLTLPDFYSQECETVENTEQKSFRAIFNGSDQTIPSATMTELEFWVAQWNVEDAGFDASVYGHKIDKNDQKGYWHYNVAVRIDSSKDFVVAGLKNGTVVARARSESALQVRLAFDYEMLIIDDIMSIGIFISGGADAGVTLLETWFGAHRITGIA